MLTPLVYSILARKQLIDSHRRAFLVLLTEYDLHDFKAIDPQLVMLKYDFTTDDEVSNAIRFWCQVGILEPGPRVNLQLTYRIRPEHWISMSEIEALEKQMRERSAREVMAY